MNDMRAKLQLCVPMLETLGNRASWHASDINKINRLVELEEGMRARLPNKTNTSRARAREGTPNQPDSGKGNAMSITMRPDAKGHGIENRLTAIAANIESLTKLYRAAAEPLIEEWESLMNEYERQLRLLTGSLDDNDMHSIAYEVRKMRLARCVCELGGSGDDRCTCGDS